MRYYCKNCKTEFKFQGVAYDPDEMCPICGNEDPDYDLIPIPDYETIEQWEKRTGKPYPDDGAVWVALGFGRWVVREFWYFKDRNEKDPDFFEVAVIADPPVPPPDNWRPNESYT